MFPQKKKIEVTHIDEQVIIIEGEKWHRHNKDYELIIIKELVDVVNKLTKPVSQSGKPIFALAIKINKQILIMADVSLVLGTPKTGIFTLLDNKTLAVLSATFSNQAVGPNSNPELATFALDPANPNQVIGTGNAAGSGTVVITTHADWTDPGDNSAQSSDFSVTKNYTVVATADGASFDVVFP